MTECVLAWPTQALLGEGPIWVPDAQTSYDIDISGGKLHRYVPASGHHESMVVDGRPSFVVPVAGGPQGAPLLAGSEDGLYLVEETGC